MPILTKRLGDALDIVKTLPPERQDDAAETLFALLDQGHGVHQLTAEEDDRLARTQRQARQGEVASNEDVQRVLRKHDL